MSKPFTSFYNHLIPQLPGITLPMVNLTLLEVARDFCHRSCAWRADLPAMDSEDDSLTYPIFGPESDSEVVKVLLVRLAGELLWSAHGVDPDAEEQPEHRPDRPPFVLSELMDAITFNEQPAGSIDIKVAMKPAFDATSLPDILLLEHLQAIRDGVLGRLMVMPGKPWTDQLLGPRYLTDYDIRVQRAAVRAQSGNTRSPLRTRLSPL